MKIDDPEELERLRKKHKYYIDWYRNHLACHEDYFVGNYVAFLSIYIDRTDYMAGLIAKIINVKDNNTIFIEWLDSNCIQERYLMGGAWHFSHFVPIDDELSAMAALANL